VAFDGTRYLMVWQDVTNSSRNIWGQFISRAGALGGNAFPITSAAGTQSLDPMKPLAFGAGKYIAVYRDNRSGTNAVYGQLVSALGSLFGPEIPIDSDGLPAQEAAVAFDGANFLVVWQKRTGDAQEQYHTCGLFITPTG